MNSRARLSWGRPTRLPPPSSQTSIAGSTIIAWASARKSPAQPALGGILNRHQLREAYLGDAGGEMTVQNHVIRSGNCASTATIRSSHHTCNWRASAACSRRCAWRAWMLAALARRGAGAPKSGTGVAATPASDLVAGWMSAASVASKPPEAAASSRPRRGPSPTRCSSLRTASRSAIVLVAVPISSAVGHRESVGSKPTAAIHSHPSAHDRRDD